MTTIAIDEPFDQPRRRFLGTAAMTLAPRAHYPALQGRQACRRSNPARILHSVR
jgi:hypothetical protein